MSPIWIATGIAALAAFAISAGIAPVLIKTLTRLKFGQKILEDGPTWHKGKQNTPTMGGLIFIIGMALPLLFFLPRAIREQDLRPYLMLALALLFGAIGFLDDYTKIKKKRNQGLTAIQKLLLQIVAAALFVTLLRIMGFLTPHFYIPFLNVDLNVPWGIYLACSIFIIVGAVNAVNLTDGIDGLCASVTFVVAAFFTAAFAVANVLLPAAFAGALGGGLLGFLVYNHFPAKVFMGDTGSLFLGGAVCAMAFAYDMPIILAPVGIIYIIEALSDILQVGYYKLSHGKRIFKMAPIHHHFEMCGWSEGKIVFVFTLITVLTCGLSYWFVVA